MMNILDGIRKLAAKESFKEKYGITHTEKTDPSHSVNSIGYSPSKKKWYGWSHRAISGFGIGSKVKKGDCAFMPSNKEEFLEDLKNWYGKKAEFEEVPGGVKVTNGKCNHVEEYPKSWGRGEWTAKTMEDAKRMAIDFAKGVS